MATKDSSGSGSGDGSGGGQEKVFAVESVTIGDKVLKDAEVDPSGEIKVTFNKKMTTNKEENIKAISITGAEVEVAMDGDSAFIVKYSDLKAGDHELVVAKTVKPNNNKDTLAEDYKVAFKVKEA